ncbi:MAG: hypothetical protein CMH46_04835 [Muricauda sp.]|nr:hypothetical protein [Allomuricauda sp.]
MLKQVQHDATFCFVYDRDKNDNLWGHFDMRNEVTKNLSVDLLDSIVINQVRIQNKNGPKRAIFFIII